MNNILIWGGKSKTRILLNVISNPGLTVRSFLKSKKNKIIGIFDPYLNEPNFKTKYFFSNNKIGLDKIIKKSNSFIVGIGGEFGKERYLISQELIKRNLKPLNIVSKQSIIDKTSKLGKGIQIMPNAVVHCYSQIGDYCILNTGSIIDHECIIGNGVHIMGGAVITGRVKIGSYVTIGSNATIFPNVTIEEGAFVGAGAVVKKNIKRNHVVVGNPSKYSKLQKQQSNLKIFNKNFKFI